MSDSLLSALMGAQYQAKENPFGIAAQSIAANTGNLINPYGSAGSNAAATIGAALLAGLLGGVARSQTQSDNAELSPLLGQMMTATPEQRQALVQQNDRLSPLANALAAQEMQQKQDLAKLEKETTLKSDLEIAALPRKLEIQNSAELSKQKMLAPGEIAAERAKSIAKEQARVAADMGRPLTPKEKGEIEQKYAFEISGAPQTRTFSELSRQMRVLDESLKKDNPVAATTSIYALAKILDPNSVVREGEFHIVADPGSPVQILNSALSQIKGEGKLTPTIKSNIRSLMQPLLQQNHEAYQEYADSLLKTMESQGGSRKNIQLLGIPQLSAEQQTAPEQVMPQVKIDQAAQARAILRARGVPGY